MPMPPGRLFCVIMAAGLSLLISACQSRPPITVPVTQKPRTEMKRTAPAETPMLQGMALPPKGSAKIHLLMARAKAGEDIYAILSEFDHLIATAYSPLRQEARFRKVQLLLEHQQPGASDAAFEIIKAMPNHALTPYCHFWLARWWLKQQRVGRALAEMRLALLHNRLTRELADDILDLAPSVARSAPERDAVKWLLAAAEIDIGGRDSWLRFAARRASLETIERLHSDGSLPPQLMAGFDLHAGRAYLMTGQIATVRRIRQLLANSLPDSREAQQLQAWANGEIRAATIGVLLPLTGQFARYGEAALRGVRMAMEGLDSNAYITLRIEDTASSRDGAIAAYHQLAAESVNMIIGPLLAESTEALLPYLRPELPVMSLTGRIDLADASPALFIHTMSPLAQVYFMANYAWLHGARKLVVIDDGTRAGGLSEAEMFASVFSSLGGKILNTLHFDEAALDHRDELRLLRYETDEEELLSELDEDLDLLLPDIEMEIDMPINFDAIYLAQSGKQVSLLAGQLAYSGITGIPLYGSSRWQDGHLMDDRGRYLSRARFASSGRAAGAEAAEDDPQMQRLSFMHREAWGDELTSELTLLAYDSMRIIAVITSRLGLNGQDILNELREPEGFRSITGRVRFDASGVGQKQMDVFRVRKGKIVPAG